MNNTKSPVTKEEKSLNGRHFSESNQSAFRRISSIKSDPTDKTTEKPSKNGTSHSTDDLLTNKASLSNSFLSPLISSSTDFHSHLALLRPFLSQTLPFVPSLTPPSYWHTLPFLHPYLSSLRPPGLLPPPTSSLPTSSSSSLSSSSVQPKLSTSTNNSNKKSSSSSSSSSSSATHYHQYTITNNNVLVPSPATLIDFIRRPATSNGSSANTHTPGNASKSKNLKKYKCDICSRAFSRSNTLVTHKRIHTGEKPFVCEICDRAFRQPGNLTRHKLTHTAAKPYSCPICSKAFNRASNLHAHQRTHSIIMPMITKPMTATTTNNNNNNNNNSNNKTNNGTATYKCNECHEVFGHKFELTLHTAAIHHSQMSLYTKSNVEEEIDDGDGDDEEDIEDEQSYEKEDASDESEPNIDLVED